MSVVNLCSTTTRESEDVTADLVIGSDGAFSAVRREMVKRVGFNYSQTYIEHGYLELLIPPSDTNGVRMQTFMSFTIFLNFP